MPDIYRTDARAGFDVVRYAETPALRAVTDPDDDPGDEGPSGDEDVAEGVLFGHFSVFNRWYEIDSPWEGNFLERIAPGTFTQTFDEDVQRCWFEHGYSAFLDRASLGSIETLIEDETGPYYEVRLFGGLPQFFTEGLAANEYGASFRMRILAESVVAEPPVSKDNPKGLPEVTITRVRCPEFGPVSIGASPYATASMRSATDTFYEAMRRRDPDGFTRAMQAAGLDEIPTVEPAPGGAGGGGSATNPTDWVRAAALHLELQKENPR